MARIIDAFAQFFDGEGNPLVNGWLLFLQSGTVDTKKNTYWDSSETTANANPVQLDAEGRCPNVFGSGTYKVVSYTNDTLLNVPGSQIQSFDPVGGDTGISDFGDWDANALYQEGEIIKGPDGEFYQSITSNNQNNNPTTSPTNWERIDFNRFWNTNVTYSDNDRAIDEANGVVYISKVDSNIGNQPSISPTQWEVEISGLAGTDPGDVVLLEDDGSGNGRFPAALAIPNPWLEDVDADGFNLINPTVKGEYEANSALGSVTGAQAFDISAFNSYSLTMTGDITPSFTGWPTSDLGILVLHVTDGGAHTWNWPAAVVPDGGTFPTLQTSGKDTLVLWTIDNGTTIKLKRGWKEA